MGVNITICTQYVNSMSNSTGYMRHKLIFFLEKNHNVKTISTDSDRTDANNLIVKSHELNRGFFSRLLGLIMISISLTEKVVKNVHSDEVIITGTNPIIFLLLMPILKRTKRLKWVLLVHDVYPFNLFVAQSIKNRSLRNFLEYIFKKIYDSADQIVVIGRDMKTRLSNLTQTDIDVIQNWISADDVEVIERENSTILKSINWTSDFIVFQFFGNMGRLQDIQNILTAISLVKAKNARFLFIGEGSNSDLVCDYISKYSPKNLVYFGSLDMAEKSQGLAACDVAMVSLDKEMLGLGVPSKSYFSLAAGKPILAIMDSDSEIALTVKEHGLGWCCAAANPELLASMMDKICREGVALTSSNPRETFIEYFSDHVLLPKFQSVISRL